MSETHTITLTHEQWNAVWEAVAQYVENGQCAPVDDPYAADPLLTHAETVLECLDNYKAALAEGGPVVACWT